MKQCSDKNLKFLCGGKLGDFIHCLFAVKHLCEKYNKKADIVLTDNPYYGGDNFHGSYPNALMSVFYNIYPIIMHQSYVSRFSVSSIIKDIKYRINLNDWRQSSIFLKDNWTNILSDLHGFNPIHNSWIRYRYNSGMEEYILIHRSGHRHNQNFPWERIIKNNKCYFITNLKIEYDIFPYKDHVQLMLCDSLCEIVKNINSCKIFIGNMSAILAIAQALGKTVLAELTYPDEVHYIGEEEYNRNRMYLKSDGVNGFVENIDNFINY